MSDTAIAHARGGEHATARRGGIAEDYDFIQAKRRQGVPDTAIAHMIGRPLAEVRQIARPTAGKLRPAPAIPKRPEPRVVLSLFRGLIEVKPTPPVQPNTMEAIAHETARQHRLSVSELRGDGRKRYVAWPRQEAMYLTRQETLPDGSPRYSLQQIGLYYGGRDHTTVLHAINAHESRLKAAHQ